MTAAPLTLQVNGRATTLTVPHEASLLHVLRNDLRLNGPKYGCGLGECGACLVLVDGVAARSCVIPAHGVAKREITTLEGLGRRAGRHAMAFALQDAALSQGDAGQRLLHPVQLAFIECQAAQCGYCLNGMILSTVALLEREPRPSDAQVRSALSHNLCRCGTHLEILQAVQRAAEMMAAVPLASQ